MSMELPSAPGTDGAMLADMAVHSLIRDMITRRGVDGPKYGVNPQTYGQVGAGGFQAIFVDDLTLSLELGAFKYATSILDNHMTTYVRRGGSILYRGLQMQSQGRTLTLLALFHDYTGDPFSLLTKHYNKTAGIIGMLRKRRARALLLPKSDYGYGMPTGNDEADEGVTTFNCAVDFGGTLSPKLDYPNGACVTELPYVPIVAEMVRGFTELGEVYVKLGKSSGHADMAASGSQMLSEAAAVKADMLANIERSSFPSPLDMPTEAGAPRGYPHVFGWHMMQGGPRNDTQMAHPPAGGNYKRPTLDVYTQARAYPEMFYSAQIPEHVMRDIIIWNRFYSGSLRLNTWGGPVAHERPNSCLNVFTAHGLGYGYLLLDRVDDFLLFLFAEASHGYSRGTWTATEDSTLDRRQWNGGKLGGGSGYCAPSQTLLPTLMKWLLVWEDPRSRTLWLGRAVPRVWLSDGKRVAVRDSSTRYGRVSFSIDSQASGTGLIMHANITLPAGFRASPGGLKLRLRSPGAKLSSVTVGGKPLELKFNATEETITFDAASMPDTADLQRIVASFASKGTRLKSDDQPLPAASSSWRPRPAPSDPDNWASALITLPFINNSVTTGGPSSFTRTPLGTTLLWFACHHCDAYDYEHRLPNRYCASKTRPIPDPLGLCVSSSHDSGRTWTPAHKTYSTRTGRPQRFHRRPAQTIVSPYCGGLTRELCPPVACPPLVPPGTAARRHTVGQRLARFGLVSTVEAVGGLRL